jgi:methylmalonyl-CoA/ethylmalonyl-CoA epimerase
MIKGIYGLNIAVSDLDAASRKYEKILGVPGKPIGEEGFAFPGLKGTNFNVRGFHLNLITSMRPDTSIARFIQKKGEGVFLLSLEVDDLDGTLGEMRTQGLNPLLEESAKGPFGEVNFVHPKDMNGVQLEIYKPAE